MKNLRSFRSRRLGLSLLAVGTLFTLATVRLTAESGESTRITNPSQHQRSGQKSYPYRAKSDYILSELDLKEGDVILDIGAGDGWWAEKFAPSVGAAGTVHAGEVAVKKVDGMKKKFARTPQVKPYLMPKDGTGLAEDSCDVVFFSQSYHHLNKDGHVGYLKHLHSVVKPTGRVVIIEKYTETGLGAGTHGTRLSRLVRQAEEAEWVPVRLELMTGTYHYIAILVQQGLFPPEPKKRPRKPKPVRAVKPVIIDVRTREEWEEGHIQSALHVPHDEIGERIATHVGNRDREIILYCRSGGRAGMALKTLKGLGYQKVRNAGGYEDLKKTLK